VDDQPSAIFSRIWAAASVNACTGSDPVKISE
jgi:hypothetical protein